MRRRLLKGDPPSVAPSGCTGPKLRETTNLKVSTFACLGKCPRVSHRRLLLRTLKLPRGWTNWVRPLVPARQSQALWALVLDAAPYDVRALTEGLLATVIQEDDTELEEAAVPYDEDFLLVRAVMTGWKYYEKGERDVDVLVAAAVEAIEKKNVTDQDMLMDLIQMIQEVFDQVGFPCPLGGLALGSACHGT